MRQKRNEFEAKRRQSVMTTDLKDAPEDRQQPSVTVAVPAVEVEAKSLEPTVVPVIAAEEVEAERAAATDPVEVSIRGHSVVSVDLFGSKSHLEVDDEDMDVDNETVREDESQINDNSNVTEKPESKSSTTESNSSQSESNSSESESNTSSSTTESKSEAKSDANTESKVDSTPETSAQSTSAVDTEMDTELKTTSAGESSSDSSSADSSLSSSASTLHNTSSLNLNSTSPLSVSVIHSSGDYLVSSPTTADPTLNFTFNASSDEDSQSFDPFIHTNRSFHTNTTFYETTSPLQLSFMVREDTLCILADELERQIDDIVIPDEDQNLTIYNMSAADEPTDLYAPLRRLDDKELGFTCESLTDDKALISYLWGTFALEVRFGDVVPEANTAFTVRRITAINMKSLVSAEEPLKMRQKGLLLKFNDFHKPLITIAHDLIISSFETEEQHIKSKHKTSASLDELVSYISIRAMSAKRLLSELRVIASSEVCRLYPKVNDTYRLVVEILALRKPIQLILPINAKSYPDEAIHPRVRIPAADKHFYWYVLSTDQFSAAFLRIERGKFNYIQRLIKATKALVRAKKRLMYEKQQNLRQKQEIESARLTESILISKTNT
ncbi:unnamed protein product [Medioppia subpectinata]|uniref:Uncharacterized protein n=1 Tax=Medioppia subpectinata TaxID=1979941 RepID=A0A7R9LCK4_9ACAR|nr:unnamed protein product [Medioppia subpectinata]CAG2117342.1 unnamed protein product [Medioppia subpectinata]